MTDLQARALEIRQTMIEMAEKAGTGHIASGLSMVEILTVLYFEIMALGVDPQTLDHLVLSKGHGALALYATLYRRGILTESMIRDYHADDTCMTTFPTEPFFPSVLFSSGSLGHGPGVACGAALAKKRDGHRGRVFTILSDGECQEGSIWESALFARQHQLGNLTFVIDNNRLQAIAPTAEVLDLEPFAEKWQSFGFDVQRVDGHDLGQLGQALRRESLSPKCIIAETRKGKGISFMENSIAWHYLPITQDWIHQAKAEIGPS